jgi:hypothetical protein
VPPLLDMLRCVLKRSRPRRCLMRVHCSIVCLGARVAFAAELRARVRERSRCIQCSKWALCCAACAGARVVRRRISTSARCSAVCSRVAACASARVVCAGRVGLATRLRARVIAVSPLFDTGSLLGPWRGHAARLRALGLMSTPLLNRSSLLSCMLKRSRRHRCWAGCSGTRVLASSLLLLTRA